MSLTEGFLGALPFSPAGGALWDCLNCDRNHAISPFSIGLQAGSTATCAPQTLCLLNLEVDMKHRLTLFDWVQAMKSSLEAHVVWLTYSPAPEWGP